MAYPSWTPLWSGIVESSLWDESDSVVKVFLTMLATKDSDNVVRLNAYQLAKKSNKSEKEVLEAITILSSPDKRRVENQEFEGRRIQMVEEGWLILNGEKYRKKVQEEMKRARNRRAQAAWRERQKQAEKFPAPSKPLAGELEHEHALKNGASQERLDEIVTDHLPDQCQEKPPEYKTKPPPETQPKQSASISDLTQTDYE